MVCQPQSLRQAAKDKQIHSHCGTRNVCGWREESYSAGPRVSWEKEVVSWNDVWGAGRAVDRQPISMQFRSAARGQTPHEGICARQTGTRELHRAWLPIVTKAALGQTPHALLRATAFCARALHIFLMNPTLHSHCGRWSSYGRL